MKINRWGKDTIHEDRQSTGLKAEFCKGPLVDKYMYMYTQSGLYWFRRHMNLLVLENVHAVQEAAPTKM